MPKLTPRQFCLIILGTLIATALCACGREDVWEASSYVESSPYYDARYFTYEDGRYAFRSADAVGRTGVDVSEYQGSIDWEAAAYDGIDFAFVRIGYRGSTEGGLYADERFEENVQGAQAAGIDCGVYFFSQATSVAEAEEEAAFVLSLLAYRELEYPVVFDYEFGDGTRIAHLDRDTATACARAFCDAIKAGDYTPMLYGNAWDLDRLHMDELGDYELWLAEYDGPPVYAGRFAIWQYTANGSVAGFGSSVDLNLDLGYRPDTP